MQSSPAIETHVRDLAEKLARFHERITGCHVTVEAPHQHHQKGQLFSVRIDLIVPGAELVVSRDKPNPEHEDVHVAIRDAFDAAVRRLEDHVRRSRGDVKRKPA